MSFHHDVNFHGFSFLLHYRPVLWKFVRIFCFENRKTPANSLVYWNLLVDIPELLRSFSDKKFVLENTPSWDSQREGLASLNNTLICTGKIHLVMVAGMNLNSRKVLCCRNYDVKRTTNSTLCTDKLTVTMCINNSQNVKSQYHFTIIIAAGTMCNDTFWWWNVYIILCLISNLIILKILKCWSR